jgi:ribosome maturation protein SDO1
MINVDKAVVARMNKGGLHFEVLVDLEGALKIRDGKEVDMKDVLAAEEVFYDSKRGTMASTSQMKNLFGTDEPEEVARIIIQKGDMQLTKEHRKKLSDEKKRRIISIIATNGEDPATGNPHTVQRIESAFNELKIKINESESAEAQVQDVLKKLKAALPIKFETKEMEIKVEPHYSRNCHAIVQRYGTISRNEWDEEGSFSCTVEIPAGMQNDLIDELNKMTKGSAEIKITKK